jgi:hypothetical protein
MSRCSLRRLSVSQEKGGMNVDGEMFSLEIGHNVRQMTRLNHRFVLYIMPWSLLLFHGLSVLNMESAIQHF